MKSLLCVVLCVVVVLCHSPHHGHHVHKSHKHQSLAKQSMQRMKSKKGLYMQQMAHPHSSLVPESELGQHFAQVVQHLENIIQEPRLDLESFGGLCKEILVLKHRVHRSMAHQAQMIVMNQEILQQILRAREDINNQPQYILDRQYIADGHVFDQNDLCVRYSSRLAISAQNIRPLMGRQLVMHDCPSTVLSYMQYNMAYYWPSYSPPVYHSVQQMASPYLALSGATLYQDSPSPSAYLQQYNQLSQEEPSPRQDQVTQEINGNSVAQLEQEKEKLKSMLEEDQHEEVQPKEKEEENRLLGQIKQDESLDDVQNDLNGQLKEQPPLDTHHPQHNEEDSHGHGQEQPPLDMDPFQTQMQHQVHSQQQHQQQDMLAHQHSLPSADSHDMPGYELCEQTDFDWQACEEFLDQDGTTKRRRRATQEKNDLEEQNKELGRQQEQYNQQEQEGPSYGQPQMEESLGEPFQDNRFRKITQKQAQAIHQIYDSGKAVLQKAIRLAHSSAYTPRKKKNRKFKKKKNKKQAIMEQIRKNLQTRM